jgi:hypothetical protein
MNAKISLETLSQSINKFADDAIIAAKKLAGKATTGRTAENNANQTAGNDQKGLRTELVESIANMIKPKLDKHGN